ncbi:MAG: peptidase, partial [Nitrosopumilus sp.]|nr:peptidase [Nitrosopumilus sp.]
IAWEGQYGANQEIPFEFTFFNENRELIKDVRYSYIVLDEFDNEIARNDGNDPMNPGIVSVEGLDVQKIYVPSQGQIRVDILVYGTGLGYDPTYAGIGTAIIEIGPGSPIVPVKAAIPSWIKNNAEWWAAGQIDDGSFVQGIQYLIKEDVLKIPPTTQGAVSGSNDIPVWIKSNAEWWAAGQIDDDSFIQGIQYLIKEGIMRIQS